MERSATDPRLVVAVLVLLPGFGSVVPPGGEALAVFEIDPVADGATVPLIVRVTLAPGGSVGIAPEIELPDIPIDPGQMAPPRTDPQVALRPVILAGTMSVKVELLAALGPSLRMTT
jgi:hypothetical protein